MITAVFVFCSELERLLSNHKAAADEKLSEQSASGICMRAILQILSTHTNAGWCWVPETPVLGGGHRESYRASWQPFWLKWQFPI